MTSHAIALISRIFFNITIISFCCRRSLHEAGPRDSGGARLVPGSVGDHTNTPLRVRYGFAQGECGVREKAGTHTSCLPSVEKNTSPNFYKLVIIKTLAN